MPSEAAVIHEIAGVLRSAMRSEVGWRADDDEANGARERRRHHVFLYRLARANAGIETVFHDIDEPIIDVDIDCDFRVRQRERVKHVAKATAKSNPRDAQTKDAHRRRVSIGDGGESVSRGCHRRRSLLDKAGPRVGHSHAARRSNQKHDTKLGLEPGNCLTHGRRRDA